MESAVLETKLSCVMELKWSRRLNRLEPHETRQKPIIFSSDGQISQLAAIYVNLTENINNYGTAIGNYIFKSNHQTLKLWEIIAF